MKAEFLNALQKLKRELGPVVKTARGHQHRYADLAEVHRVIDGPLNANGFVLYHEFETVDGAPFMHTRLVHEHGTLSSTLPLSIQNLGGMNFYQALGSAITYLRRYAIMALLGIPAEDDDGESAAAGARPRMEGGAHAAGASRAPPEDTAQKMRAFLAGGDHHLPMPSIGGEPCPDVWAEKFLALLPLAADSATLDSLAATNGETLDRLRRDHTELSTRIMQALRKRQAEVRT
jgi:hypothetical protein